MLKKIFTNKVSLSLIITALILIGTVVSPLQGLISFSATNYDVVSEDYKRSSTVSPELSSSHNLLYNRPYHSVYQSNNGTNTTATAVAQIANAPYALTDGKTSTSTFLPGSIYFNDDGTRRNTAPYENPNYYTDLTYSFASKSTVHEVWIYHYRKDSATQNDTSDRDMVTRVYQVYLSDKVGTLYDKDSLVCTYENTDAKNMQKIKFAQPYTDKQYIGIRYLVPTVSKDASPVPRIFELAAFGTPTLPESTVTTGDFTSTDVVSDLTSADNLLFNREYKKLVQQNNTSIITSAYNGDKKAFTDGNLAHKDINNKIYFDATTGAPHNVSPYLAPKYYTDISYEFEDNANINEIWVYNCDTTKYATYAYQLFLSYNEDDLFLSESMVASYENTANAEYQKFVFDTPIKNKGYFGIRILMSVAPDTPNTSAGVPINGRNVRFAEVAVFGELKPELVKVTEDNYTQTTSDSALTVSNNLLYNREYNSVIQFENGKDSSKGAEAKLKADPKGYTDGNVSANVQLDGQIYFNADGTPKNTAPYNDPKYYTSVTYFLGGKSTVNEVWVYNANRADLTTHVYQIYLGDSRETLYNPENHIYTYTNENNTTRQKFVFPKTFEGTYFGIKILVATSGDTTSLGINAHYARLTQLAVFGTVNEVTEEEKGDIVIKEPDYIADLYKKYKRNLVKGYTPKLYYNDGEGEKTATSANNVSNLTNENTTDQFFCGQPRFAELVGDSTVKYYKDGTERYFKISFNLRTSCDISHILFVNCATEKFRTLDYEVYLSDNADDLFNGDKMVKHYKNTSLDLVNNIEFSEAKTAQYVGFKILYPASEEIVPHLKDGELIDDLVYTRLNEIAIFGDYTDPDFEFPPSYAIDPYMTNDQLAALGNSIVAGQMASCRYTDTPLKKGYYSNKELQFTDGDITTHVDVNNNTTETYKLKTTDGSNYVDFVYSWDEVKYDITGFLFAGCKKAYDNSVQYYTGWYQVYIGDEIDDLFLPENIAFEYKWDGENYERGHLVNFDTPKRGAYFAIRILNPVSGAPTSIGMRVAEIAVYGEKANIPILPTNLAINMPVEAYTENSKGDLKSVSEKELTAKEIKNLTDGNTSTTGSIKTKNTVHLIYNLCNDANIDAFKLTSNAKKYKVYATSDMNKIWSDSSLVYTYNGSGTNGITLPKSKNVRYVRFEISSFGSELNVSEVECIGGDNQILKYKKLSRSFSGNQLSLSSYDPKAKSQKYLLAQMNGSTSLVFDSGYNTPLGFWGGTNDEVYLDLTLTLDDVRNIDKIALSFPKVLPGYSPTKLEIYTSEELSEFEDSEFDLKPVATYDGDAILGTFTATFAPRLARTILVRFVCGHKDYDPYLNNQMTFALTEFEVSGTAVKGMQKDPENEVLLTFKDKKTGVTVEILKYDTNDIFTKAAKLKVEKVDATLAQKKELATLGALKAIGDAVYKVSLLDASGNPLENAGGREVRISLPCDVEKYGYPLVAQSTKDGIVALDAVSEPTKQHFTTTVLEDTNYIVAAFISASDPYFEILNIEVPEDPTFENYEDLGNLNDDFSGESGTESPATGEKLPVLAIAILLLAFAVCNALIKKPIK